MGWLNEFTTLINNGVRKIRFTYGDGSTRDIHFDGDILGDFMNIEGTDMNTGETCRPAAATSANNYAVSSVEEIK